MRTGCVTRFLVLTDCADREVVFKAIAAGASGYLLKTAAPADIVDAMKRVVNGGNILSAELSDGLVRHIS